MTEIAQYIQSNKEWIFSGVGIATIGFIFFVVRVIYARYWRKQVSVIRIEKNLDIVVIDIAPELMSKTENRLKILYDDAPINGIYELMFTIHNLGNEPIENIILSFCTENFVSVDFTNITLTSEERISPFILTPPPVDSVELCQDDSSNEQLTVSDSEVNIKILDPNESFFETCYGGNPNVFALHAPYLNPWRSSKDYIGVTIISPEKLLIDTVVGKGVGWKTKYVDRTKSSRRIINFLVTLGELLAKISRVRWDDFFYRIFG